MGWFSRNRRPFSKAFLERLDRIEAAVESLVEPESAFEVPAPEVIPAEIVSTRTVGGVEEFAWREVTTDPNDTGGRSSDGVGANGDADLYAFAAKNSAESETFVVKHWVATSQPDGNGGTYPLHDVRYTIVGGGAAVSADNGFWSLLNGSQNFGSTARWRYAWQEMVPDGAGGWMVPDGGSRFGTAEPDGDYALNTLESANTGTVAYGINIAAQVCNGASAGRYIIHDTEGDFEFQAVPGGSVVWMRIHTFGDGTTQALFQAPNPIDGECDNPLAECPPP
jgi:hypothetical protein